MLITVVHIGGEMETYPLIFKSGNNSSDYYDYKNIDNFMNRIRKQLVPN